MDEGHELDRLADQARSGDDRAWEELDSKVRVVLQVKLARWYPRLGGAVDVEDLVQSTLLRTFLGLDRFEGARRGSFLRWLLLVARSTVWDEIRRQARRLEEAGARSDDSEQALNEHPAPGAPDQLDDRIDLKPKLALLAPDERAVLWFRLVEGNSRRAIADDLGVSIWKVREIEGRALKRLLAPPPTHMRPDRRLALPCLRAPAVTISRSGPGRSLA